MIKINGAFSGFSVNNLDKAYDFYSHVIGLEVTREDKDMGLKLTLPGGSTVFIYPKETHQPATFTVLNFEVENIDEAVDQLVSQGIQFEHYEGDIATDDRGVLRGKAAGYGPDIAWFKDPAGNVLSILES